MSTILIIILTLLAVGIIAFVIYKLLQYLRGSIRILLYQTSFNTGEIISGSFELKTRKRIEGYRLSVALIGEEIREEKEHNSSTETTTREIYRNEVLLEQDVIYETGMSKNYNFKIPTYDLQDSSNDTGLFDNPLGETLKTGLEVAGALGLIARHYLKWKVEVKLEAKGIDLVNSKEITINNINYSNRIL